MIMAFSISGVLGVLAPFREVVEDVVGTAREQLRDIVLFLPDIVDRGANSLVVMRKPSCWQRVKIEILQYRLIKDAHFRQSIKSRWIDY